MQANRRVRTGIAALAATVGVLGSVAAYAAVGSAAPVAARSRVVPPVASLVSSHATRPDARAASSLASSHGGTRLDARLPSALVAGHRAAGGDAGFPSAGPAVAPFPGVGPLPAGWVAAAHTVQVGGLERTYMTIEPRALAQPVPVVVLMHGRGMTPAGILRISDLIALVGQAVVIVPAGWHSSWNAGDCCGTAYLHHVDDVTFISDAVGDVLAATPLAEASQVFAVGFSNGGRMAYALACDMPGMFAGFMAVEAVPVQRCSVRRPFDITIVAQQDDPLLTVDASRPPKSIEGFVEPTVAATVTRMELLDGCAGPPAVTPFGVAVERTWDCAQGAVRYVWYPGGGHDWRPATPGTPGATDFVLQMLHHGGPPPQQAP